MLGDIRERIRGLDPAIPVLSAQTFQRFHRDSFWVWLVTMGGRLFATFGGLALLLAAVGLYGVRASDVARRTRQIGIRMALGATARNVLSRFLWEGIILASLGLVLGLPLALGAGFLLRGLLVGVSATDLATFVAVPALLMAATMLACWIPARRAARIDPMKALRS